jgi:hypothetical protein
MMGLVWFAHGYAAPRSGVVGHPHDGTPNGPEVNALPVDNPYEAKSF